MQRVDGAPCNKAANFGAHIHTTLGTLSYTDINTWVESQLIRF